MLEEILSSWELFHLSFLAGWLSCLCLSLAGILVVAKRQVFLGAALSQASIFGISLVLVLEAVEFFGLDEEMISHGAAVLFSLLGAGLVYFLARKGRSHNEICSLIFLLCASGAILLVSGSPHGTDEVHSMMASSLLGATDHDVWILVGTFAVLLILGFWKYRELGLFLIDSQTASAVGLSLRLWDFGSAAVVGFVVGFCLKVTGLLFTFGYLVLPVLAGRELIKRLSLLPMMSCLIAFSTCTLAYLITVVKDLPPAQVAVFLLCLCWLGTMGIRGIRESG